MRLDEYQKWLDAQFLDVPAAPEQAAVGRTQTLTEAPPLQTESAGSVIFQSEAVVGQRPAEPAPDPRSSLPPLPEPEPMPVFNARQAVADDSDVPSIENYLPFLKSSQPASPPLPEVHEAAPPEAGSAAESLAAPAELAPVKAGADAVSETSTLTATQEGDVTPQTAADAAPELELEMETPRPAAARETSPHSARPDRARRITNIR